MSEPGLCFTPATAGPIPTRFLGLPDGDRFRTGWRGKLILQRRLRAPHCDGPIVHTAWRDATAEDLVHFFTLKDS